MKKIFFVLLLLVVCGFQSQLSAQGQAQVSANEEITRLEIGETLPLSDAMMMNITSKEVSLDEITEENGLLLIFSCNTCPFVIAYEDRYPEIEMWAKKANLGLALINSNEAKRNKEESMDDSLEAMQAHAKEANYDCYYLLDKDHALADAIGAFTTPEVFLFNSKKELVYKGAIDDNWKDKSEVKQEYLVDAIVSLMKGDKIKLTEAKGRGCSIKRLK